LLDNVHNCIPSLGGDVPVRVLEGRVKWIIANQDVRAQIGCENDQGVPKIHFVPLGIRKESFIQYLKSQTVSKCLIRLFSKSWGIVSEEANKVD
jgi:hypothetical protein